MLQNLIKKFFSKFHKKEVKEEVKKKSIKDKFDEYCENNPDADECRIYDI